MSRLLLVRHGQSTWNAEGRWQGQADPPLSELGREQAQVAAALIDRADALWSSDLRRAHQTAEILALPHGAAVRLDPRVRERAAGPWTGLTRDEIEAQFPGYLADGHRPDGFETDDALIARALDALRDFASHLGGGVGVVVTHGGVILAVERAHGLERTPIENLGARWIEIVDGASSKQLLAGERVALR